MITTLLFDLDETLLDFHKAEEAAIKQTLLQLNIEPTPKNLALYSAINDSLWKLLEQGKRTREQLVIERFALLFAELKEDHSSALAQSIYQDQLSQQAFLLPGARELLEQLQEKYSLYVVSNGTACVQDSRLAKSGIAGYFKAIFISQRIGFHKPQVEFFQSCFSKIPDFHPNQTMIIGDSLTSDMQGGVNAGIYTCWYNPKKLTAPAAIPIDFQIFSLGELPQLLEQFCPAHQNNK